MSVTVVPVDEENVGTAFALRFAWRALERGEVGLTLADYQREALRWYHKNRQTHEGFLAFDDGVAVALAWLVTIDRVPAPAHFIRRAGMIQSVYVEANRRNEGVGSVLMNAVIGYARERGLEYLMVHPSAPAFPFYRRLGFRDADKALELRFTS